MGERARILLNDDHKTVRRLLEAIVLVRGDDKLYAENGREGIALARRETPGLVCSK